MLKFSKKMLFSFLTIFTLATGASFADTHKNVPIDKTWDINFTKEVSPESIKDGMLYILDSNYNRIPTKYSVSEDKSHLYVWSDSILLPKSNYSIYISKNIQSASGEKLSNDTIYKYSTEKLKELNKPVFEQKLQSETVDFSFTDGSSTVNTTGIVSLNKKGDKIFAYTYLPKELKCTSLILSKDGRNLSGSIYYYDKTSSLLVVEISSGLSSSALPNVAEGSTDVFAEFSFGELTASYNISGEIVSIKPLEDLISDYKVFASSIPDKTQNIRFNNLRALNDSLLPPEVTKFEFDELTNKITLQLNTENNYVIYYSFDKENFYPLKDSNGNLRILTSNYYTMDENTFGNVDLKEFETLTLKIYSSKSGELSSNHSRCSTSIAVLDDTARKIKIVKDGKFNPSDSRTIGDILHDYFSSPDWTSAKGKNEVTFTGTGFYNGRYSSFNFLFSVAPENSNYRIEEVLIDGFPLNFSELPKLLSTIS